MATIPLCHPDREHEAKGLCGYCYHTQWLNSKRGYKPRRRIKILPDDMPHWSVPYRIEGVRQNAVTSFPIPACPHCGNTRLVYEGREARCPGIFAGCGHTVYLVLERA